MALLLGDSNSESVRLAPCYCWQADHTERVSCSLNQSPLCFAVSSWSKQMPRRHSCESRECHLPTHPFSLGQRHLFHQLLGVLAAKGLASLCCNCFTIQLFHLPSPTYFSSPWVLILRKPPNKLHAYKFPSQTCFPEDSI